ncbi:MAG: hypothetical protein KDC53_11535 [Saprospiraceae bacterium]|nr:hypothetical protein [Saprospiraceae bacterium]
MSDDNQDIIITSGLVYFRLYIMVIIMALLPLVIIVDGFKGAFHAGMVIAGLIFLGIMGILIYQIIYTSTARIQDDRIILKKQFRSQRSYTFDQIRSIGALKLGGRQYITLKMRNDAGIEDKFLISKSNSILPGRNFNALQLLKSLRDKARKAKNLRPLG